MQSLASRGLEIPMEEDRIEAKGNIITTFH